MPTFVWEVSLSKATSIFARHLLMASIESATSSTLVSQSRSSGSTDQKIRPASFAWTLHCEGVFPAPVCEREWHCDWEGGNCSEVHNLLHVRHCRFIALEYAQHHHPFPEVLWFGHMSSRSLSKSWLAIRD